MFICPRARWQHQLSEAGVGVCRHYSLPSPSSCEREPSPTSSPRCTMLLCPLGILHHPSPPCHSVLCFSFLLPQSAQDQGLELSQLLIMDTWGLPPSQTTEKHGRIGPSGTCPTGILGHSHHGGLRKREATINGHLPNLCY